MITNAPNFTLSEFESVSNRALTNTEKRHAEWHARILQRVRDAVNDSYPNAPGGVWRVHVTSFLRSTGDHATGAAVDWNVRDGAGNRNDNLTRWARDWLALRIPNEFAELIYEPGFSEGSYAHVHHARRGFSRDASANERPQILDEISEGVYRIASILPYPRPVSLGVLLLVAICIYVVATRS